MKSIPIWNQGDFTGIGFNSGLSITTLRLYLWQTSQVDIYIKTIIYNIIDNLAHQHGEKLSTECQYIAI